MGLNTNATMIFTPDINGNAYEVTDSGISMHFVCENPGPAQPSDYYILLTDADIAGVQTPAQFRTLVISKLQRKFRAQGIASRLDQYVGQSVVI